MSASAYTETLMAFHEDLRGMRARLSQPDAGSSRPRASAFRPSGRLAPSLGHPEQRPGLFLTGALGLPLLAA
jgi:hypothetical protein